MGGLVSGFVVAEGRGAGLYSVVWLGIACADTIPAQSFLLIPVFNSGSTHFSVPESERLPSVYLELELFP